MRELRRDLHMRPFEADRRVYLIFGAHLLNAEAADALLKDLEEPPPYAVIVLVADELGPLPETIRSRCQLVPFRRLSERAIRAEVDRRAPGSRPTRRRRSRASRPGGSTGWSGCSTPRRPAARRSCSRSPARLRRPGFDPTAAAQIAPGARGRAGRRGEAAAEQALAGLEPARPGGRAVRQARRAWGRARGDPARARGARRVVPRPGRRRGRGRARRRSTTTARRAGRGRGGRPHARRRGAQPRPCGRLARVRGVQRLAAARAGGAVRAAAARARRRPGAPS